MNRLGCAALARLATEATPADIVAAAWLASELLGLEARFQEAEALAPEPRLAAQAALRALLEAAAVEVLPSLGNGAVHGVTDDDAGLASGVLQSLQQIGGAIGLAVLTTLALRRSEDAVAAGTDPVAATVDGYVLALQVGVVVLLVAAALAAGLLRRGEGSAADPAAGTAVAA